MKKTLTIIILFFGLISCRKNYNCNCQTVINYYGGQDQYTSSQTPIDSKLTKSQATIVCDREATSVDATYNNFITNNGSWASNSNGVYAKTSCAIQ